MKNDYPGARTRTGMRLSDFGNPPIRSSGPRVLRGSVRRESLIGPRGSRRIFDLHVCLVRRHLPHAKHSPQSDQADKYYLQSKHHVVDPHAISSETRPPIKPAAMLPCGPSAAKRALAARMAACGRLSHRVQTGCVGVVHRIEILGTAARRSTPCHRTDHQKCHHQFDYRSFHHALLG